jgi:hypothetical protein
MNKNKVNPWMISTAVLALVVGFLIGCESPRQQVSAQTPEGITAIEMELVLNKFFPKGTDFVEEHISNVPGGESVLLYEVPIGKYLVVESFGASNGNLIVIGQGENPANNDGPTLLYPGDQLEYTAGNYAGQHFCFVLGYLLNAD